MTRDLVKYLLSVDGYGINQFAYQRGVGAIGVLLFLILTWLTAFSNDCKLIVFSANVSGASDNVSGFKLMSRLLKLGVPSCYLRVLLSWLSGRTAKVVVGGGYSHVFDMSNMVYQGLVLGPILWNVFVWKCIL